MLDAGVSSAVSRSLWTIAPPAASKYTIDSDPSPVRGTCAMTRPTARESGAAARGRGSRTGATGLGAAGSAGTLSKKPGGTVEFVPSTSRPAMDMAGRQPTIAAVASTVSVISRISHDLRVE